MSVEHVCLFLIAVDTLSNTAKSEKTNNLIDDPDVAYHCLREYLSSGIAINKPRRWSQAKGPVNGRSIL